MYRKLIFGLIFSSCCFATNLNDGKTVLIIAHMDDEILIMEPLIENSMAMIFAGAAINQQKYKKLIDIYDNGPYGYKPIFLTFAPIPEKNWYYETKHPCVRDLLLYDYNATYDNLKRLLLIQKNRGMTRIVTHNPWGEYGHPVHKLISNIIQSLGVELEIDIWHDSIVHTNTIHSLTDPTPGYYLDAWFLNGVDYSESFIFNYTKFSEVKYQYQTNYQTGLSDEGIPYSIPFWTWHDAWNEYPMGERKYWRSVKDSISVIKNNPILSEQIKKLSGLIPYSVNDIHANYISEIYYTCSDWKSTPVYNYK